MTLTVPSAVLLLAPLAQVAPAQIGSSSTLLPYDEIDDVLAWCVVEAGRALASLEAQYAILADPSIATWAPAQVAEATESLKRGKAVYQAAVDAVFVDAAGNELLPLHGALIPSPAAASAGFGGYDGYAVPGLACVVGLPHIGNWWTNQTASGIPEAWFLPDFLVQLEEELEFARLDHQLLQLQLAEVTAGLHASLWLEITDPSCAPSPWSESYTLGFHRAELTELAGRFVEARLGDMLRVATRASDPTLTVFESAALDDQFQALAARIDVIASRLDAHEIALVDGSNSTRIQTAPGGSSAVEWPVVDLQAATLGIDTLDVSTPSNAQAAVQALTSTTPYPSAPLGTPFDQAVGAIAQAVRIKAVLRTGG